MNPRIDLRHALRILRRNPAASAIIVLTLALCIGANTAIFSVVDATLLRPLPFPEPARLVSIVTHFKGQGAEGDKVQQDGRAWELIRDHATFLDTAVYSDGASGVNLSAAGQVQHVQQQRVGAGFFYVLGIAPQIGREFTRQEDHTGGPPLAILSHSLWRQIFHEDPSAVGQSLLLKGEPYTIVGVMPQSFHSSVPADLWTPLQPSASGEGGGTNYAVAGRLKPDATWAQADGQLESIGAPLFKNVPQGTTARLHLISLQEGDTQNLRKPLLILWGAVGLVLLIGCANVTSLLLAKAASRSREIATRLALGSGRGAIVRQLLVETLVLAVIGGLAGLLLGYAGLEGLKKLAAADYQIVESAHLDARVLAATALLSLFVSLLAGIFPAIEAGTVDLRNALSEAGGRGVSGRHKRWSRRLLVSGEVALAVMLLIGAGLLVRTVAHLYQLNPGFNPAHVITASFSLQDARYSDGAHINQLFNAGLARMRALPGVESAGAALTLPYQRGLNTGVKRIDGPQADTNWQITNLDYVTPGYLETLKVPLLRGRMIRASDGPKAAQIVLVTEAFAKEYLSKQDPVGSHLDFGNKEIREVVGVVADVQQSSGFGDYGPLAQAPNVYVPVAQVDSAFLKLIHVLFDPSWVVRVAGSPSSVIPNIQNAASTIDPLLPIAEFRTFDDLRRLSVSSERFQATLLASLSSLALVLAIVGIYGLMSQSVVERRRELGIRMALGATVSESVREAALPGILLALAGVAVGCVLAGLSAKVFAHLVWGVTTTDPGTYASVAIGLLLVAALASLAPALRVTHLNPADTLREE
jgi:putative ABC transport system permease protein